MPAGNDTAPVKPITVYAYGQTLTRGELSHLLDQIPDGCTTEIVVGLNARPGSLGQRAKCVRITRAALVVRDGFAVVTLNEAT
jgi:hypothetical protein